MEQLTTPAALQAWIAYLNADAKNVGELGKGAFAFNTTLELTRTGVGIMGSQLKGRRTGSTRLASTLVWTGGADPMFRVVDRTAHFCVCRC
jgi:hypothetical protein